MALPKGDAHLLHWTDATFTYSAAKTAARFVGRQGHTNWALADQAMVSGANFISGILLARGLGIAEFGRFSLAWLVVAFIQSIQENAITAPMMSIGPKQNGQQQPAYFGGVFLQQAILAVIGTALTWACLRFAGAAMGAKHIVPLAESLAAAVLFCQAQEFLRRYFFTIQKPAASFASDAVRYGSQVAILFWLFFVSKTAHDVNVALWIITGASGAGALVVLMFVGTLKWAMPAMYESARRNWRLSQWLVGAAIVQWLSGNLFIVAAGALLGVAAVGALKGAQSLMGLTHILFQGLENVAPIRASQRYHAGGPVDLLRYLSKVTTVGLTATAITGICLSVYPVFWLRLLFGEGFAQYGYLVRWFAALYVVMFLGVPLRFGLRALEKTRPFFLAYLVAAVFSAATAYPLVRPLGLTGVLIGLFSTQILMLGVMAISFRRALVAPG